MLSPPLLRGSPHLVGVEGPGHRKLSSISDIVSQHNHLSAREPLAMLSKSLGSRWPSRDAIFNDLVKLIACLDLSMNKKLDTTRGCVVFSVWDSIQNLIISLFF
ncbi:uncharacterized protein LOC120264935 isoform X3 [Dioscorea cayenensis subsp. rotundata]|uniref:Uncharacterized protein LOC120264935 isoform X3 n=1 Tax=Dioscorea cayennensis subsp. rotundata TaxID=55577 RepID=A0AB40BP83_DIOCR|nr:uncharacterized protein LOC120264935 isoform X3 [Dioscorea cayenensis subsp. rotundata]